MPLGGSWFEMFAPQILNAVVAVTGCVLAVVLGLQVTSSDVNGLAVLMRWVTGIAFIISLMSPKTGIYLVLLACPVLDFVKRLLILFSSVDMLDVASVLALAPALMAGAVLGTFGSRLFFKKRLFLPGKVFSSRCLWE